MKKQLSFIKRLSGPERPGDESSLVAKPVKKSSIGNTIGIIVKYTIFKHY